MSGDPAPLPPPSAEAARRKRDRRSLAIALAIGGLVVLFYLITLFRMGPAIMNRSL